jgi:ABC-type dipeptide/oligopeptide/nickel transport system permease component
MFDKLKKLEGKATYIIGLIVTVVFVYNTYVKDNPFSNYVKNQRVQGEALNAELDLDKPIFEQYHLRLYHANKNSKGQYKYSYLNHNGRYYKAWLDPESQYWQYLDGKDVNFIKELSH